MTTSDVRAVCFNVLSLGQVSVCNLQIVHTIGFVCFHFISAALIRLLALVCTKAESGTLPLCILFIFHPCELQTAVLSYCNTICVQMSLLSQVCWSLLHTGRCSSVTHTCSSRVATCLLSSPCRTNRVSFSNILYYSNTARVPKVAAVQSLLSPLQPLG